MTNASDEAVISYALTDDNLDELEALGAAEDAEILLAEVEPVTIQDPGTIDA